MNEIYTTLRQAIIDASNFVCGYPEFFLLIGGGVFLFFYSGAVSLRRFPWALRELRKKQASTDGVGQISSIQALLSAIAATVGMGNIAGVAIALTIGGPGVIFWMWVSAIVGMTTKFFEGTLAILYRTTDSNGETQGGTMYMILGGLGKKWKPMAYAFAIFGMVGTLCFMQANQLVESINTVFIEPAMGASSTWLNLAMGITIAVIVSFVILGGIGRIAKAASRIVPVMVVCYFFVVVAIMILHFNAIPSVFTRIFEGAFTMKAGFGAFAYVALIGARRAAYVNEAGIGTASMMHGSSQNNVPVREGLIAMIGPLVDSGIVCTLTAIPIILANPELGGNEMAGLQVALGAFGTLIPGIGQYLLMLIVFFFAFSTMFSYSYYGMKCTHFLFGAKNVKYYNYYYLIMLIVAAVIKLDLLVSIMDLAFAGMAFCTMTTLIILAPKVKAQMRAYFND